MDRVVMMEGGGQRSVCPKCSDTGLHPFAESPDLECRSCGVRFEGGKS